MTSIIKTRLRDSYETIMATINLKHNQNIIKNITFKLPGITFDSNMTLGQHVSNLSKNYLAKLDFYHTSVHFAQILLV